MGRGIEHLGQSGLGLTFCAHGPRLAASHVTFTGTKFRGLWAPLTKMSFTTLAQGCPNTLLVNFCHLLNGKQFKKCKIGLFLIPKW